ncbi:flagellar basal body L-ring protein FlgH [Pelovirga terrestris]|nr:flagellar basal body L-ring protein FlgH [Pelovirga terrestris]
MLKHLLWIVVLLLVSGCAMPGQSVDLAEVEPIAPVISEPAPPQTAGSLWTTSRGGIFADMKGNTVGDIITVVISENASASKEAKTQTGRNSTMSAGITNLFGLETDIGDFIGGSPSSIVNANAGNKFDGSGKTERKEALTATLTTQVVEILPNGNLRIEGNKTVTVNREMQIVQLSGIVRPSDVSARNLVDSQNVLNARISYVGKGVISDKQQQGWLVQVLDQVWPF